MSIQIVNARIHLAILRSEALKIRRLNFDALGEVGLRVLFALLIFSSSISFAASTEENIFSDIQTLQCAQLLTGVPKKEAYREYAEPRASNWAEKGVVLANWA